MCIVFNRFPNSESPIVTKKQCDSEENSPQLNISKDNHMANNENGKY